MPKSRPPRRSPLPGLILFLCGAVVGAAALYFGWHRAPSGPPREATAPVTSAASGARPHGRAARGRHGTAHEARPAADAADDPAADPPRRADEREARPATDRAGDAAVDGVRVALVIDDLGRSVEDVETLERLGVPLTYSVLPFEEETPAVVTHLRRHGDEILCHLPMEPVHGQNPGPGALTHAMGPAELRAATAAALAAVPGAVGANNHMGSLLSADERSMHEVIGVLADRNLFFLDSRTSPESVGYRVAAALGVPAAQRQVFLDGDQRPQIIREQFARTLSIARERGAAIAIGHPHAATLAALAEEVPRAKALGYRFVPVSALLDRPRPSSPAAPAR
jgi:uncharacterized protein